MNFLHIFGALCLIISTVSATAVCKGCVSIDEHSFEKILPKFEVTLLKFDDSYPFGDKHNTFTKVAGELIDNKDIMVGQVGIKYYGDKDNEAFSEKFGMTGQKSLPVLKLFIQGEDEPFTYDKDMPWTESDIKKFIRDHTNIYLGMPGCLETFDKLAIKFTSSSDKEAVLKETESEAKKLKSEKEKNIAKTYIKFMKKVVENGVSFIKQEVKRLKKLVSGKVTEKKKEELSHRLNILKAFQAKAAKTEL